MVIMLTTLFTVFSAATIAQPEETPLPEPTLDPSTIPKYVDQLVIPPVYLPKYTFDWKTKQIVATYKVDMSEFYEQILPTTYVNGTATDFAQTKVWGYGGNAYDPLTGKYLGYFRNSPGATFETIKNIPVQVTWINRITSPHIFAVDPTLHWANPNNLPMNMMPPFPPFPPGIPAAQSPVPLVTHLHGAVVQPGSDGGPEQWFTADGKHGQDYQTTKATAPNSAVYLYTNDQEPTTLFYHDHALGLTRLNVAAGLAGFYIIRDVHDPIDNKLPCGKYDVPIAIQDRSFNTDGSMWFPTVGNNPDIHPYWNPEFFGNTIMVNGKLWPNLNVDRGQYFFRIVDGSNARFYNMSLTVVGTGQTLPFTQIMTDGGYVQSAVTENSLLIAPGERAGILVDFSKLAPGTKVIMNNTANAPFPMGDAPDANAGQIMQFTVGNSMGFKAKDLPNVLGDTLKGNSWPILKANSPSRTLPFFEAVSTIDEPTGVFLNGQKWSGILTETPRVGSTEDWWLVNPTADTHPIHTHLTQFQVVGRIPFNTTAYEADWIALNGLIPVPENVVPKRLSVVPYLLGPMELAAANEHAWKDTVQSPTGYVTIIRIRWAPQDAAVTGPDAARPGVNLYPFDPTKGPGYVWHCHIIDHEDNEMMRPYTVVP